MSRLPNLTLGVDRNAGIGAEKNHKITSYSLSSKLEHERSNQFQCYRICCKCWWESGTRICVYYECP